MRKRAMAKVTEVRSLRGRKEGREEGRKEGRKGGRKEKEVGHQQ